MLRDWQALARIIKNKAIWLVSQATQDNNSCLKTYKLFDLLGRLCLVLCVLLCLHIPRQDEEGKVCVPQGSLFHPTFQDLQGANRTEDHEKVECSKLHLLTGTTLYQTHTKDPNLTHINHLLELGNWLWALHLEPLPQ